MLKVDFATLAGLIEADGSIGIHRNNPNTRIAVVRFFNTDGDLINWVLKVFGGGVSIANSNTSYGGEEVPSYPMGRAKSTADTRGYKTILTWEKG